MLGQGRMMDAVSTEGLPSWAKSLSVGADVEVLVPALLLAQVHSKCGTPAAPAAEAWHHGIVVHVDEGELLLRVLLVAFPVTVPEVVLSRGSKSLRQFGNAHRHAARPNDAGVACDITAEQADALVLSIDAATAISSVPLSPEVTAAAWAMSDRLCRSKMRTNDDRHDMINRVLRALTAAALHDLKLAGVWSDTMRRLLGRVFLDDPHADHYLQTYGGILPTDPLAAAAVGWAVRFPPGGASRFYVANVNFFHSLGGFDTVLARLESVAARAKEQALSEGEDMASLAAFKCAVPDAASRAYSIVAMLTSLAKAGDNAHMVQPYHYQDVAASDPLLEVVTLTNIVFIPRYCYTLDWFTKYYSRVRTAALDCVFNQPASALLRTSRRAVCVVLKNLYKLGEQGCNKFTAEAEAITGEPAAGLKAFFERWSARFDARVVAACMMLTERGDAYDSAHTASAADALMHEYCTRESTSPLSGVCV